MRTFLLSLALALAAILSTHAAEPFEIRDGDRVLFLGDTLLEREGTYGYLETRMAEQFPDRKFTVRNLAFSADTPLGWSRASFDPPAKGFERLKEQLALVKPTVVFLGYGMAASLQEMTDRSQDWTLNRDPARYGAEPMSAARFKKELAQCMDAIEEVSSGAHPDGTVANAADAAKGKDAANPASPNSSSAAPAASAAVKKSPVRFVLLSPIDHDDLRKTRPGTPDPTEHNKLLEQYSKAIEELAKERGARFVSLANDNKGTGMGSGKTVYLNGNPRQLQLFDGQRDSLVSRWLLAIRHGGCIPTWLEPRRIANLAKPSAPPSSARTRSSSTAGGRRMRPTSSASANASRGRTPSRFRSSTRSSKPPRPRSSG